MNDIIDHPDQYTGPQAAMAAMKLAAYRVKIGTAAQQYKIQAAQTKKLQDRLIKDGCMVAYDGLLEMINSLKLVARHEHDLARSA